MSMAPLLSDIEAPKVSELGGKGYSLVVLVSNAVHVPKGFVVVADAFFEHLRQNNLIPRIVTLLSELTDDDLIQKSEEAKHLVLSGRIPEGALSRIEESLSNLNVQYVSVRSSAVSEDSLKASFAGLHDTFLSIAADPDPVSEAVKKCWASLFNGRAVAYRRRKKIPHLEGMAVVVQEMIPAQISGVTFTASPADERSVLVEASYGIGDLIVSGRVEPDDYLVDRETLKVVERRIGRKSKMSVADKGVTKVIGVETELSQRPVLSDDQIKQIVHTCLRVEEVFGCPQDIEWCISCNRLWVLQSRAITEA